jgi:hypothetical protein
MFQRLFRNIIWRQILSTFNFRLFTQPPTTKIVVEPKVDI